MKPKIGIESIEFKWKDCGTVWGDNNIQKINYPMFSTGGVTIQDFGFPELQHRLKHLYFYKWRFMTIRSVEKR